MSDEKDNPEGGIATLSADAVEDFNSEAPYEVSGVALPVNTVVNGGQNTDHYYPEEVLQDAAELLEGQQIVKNFHELEGQASADQVIGKIKDAGFEKGVGLVFSGEMVDEDTAAKVAQNYLEVSPTVARQLGEYDDSMGAQKVERVSGFRDLAVVANGQPGASIEPGSNPAVTALSMDALSRGFDVLSEDSEPEEAEDDNPEEEPPEPPDPEPEPEVEAVVESVPVKEQAGGETVTLKEQ